MAFVSDCGSVGALGGFSRPVGSHSCTFTIGKSLPDRKGYPARTRRCRARICWSVQSNLGNDRENLASKSISPDIVREYERYLRDVAKSGTPPHLDGALHILAVLRGEEVMRPNYRSGLHPFVIPLSKNLTQNNQVTGLLRWPTPPPNMELPVVRCIAGDLGVELLANSCTDFVKRELASVDYGSNVDARDSIRSACSLALAYEDGAVDKSGLGLERYLLMKVAPFPDVYEGLARFHLAKQDTKSGLIACERAASAFPGWGRAHVFHARVLLELDRKMEARDSARFGLQMPLWTLGTRDAVMKLGEIAGYKDSTSLGKIYHRLFEDKREKEIADGKAPQQVALDRAAFLLDSYVAEGTHKDWNDDVRELLAELYTTAGLDDIATFVRY